MILIVFHKTRYLVERRQYTFKKIKYYYCRQIGMLVGLLAEWYHLSVVP